MECCGWSGPSCLTLYYLFYLCMGWIVLGRALQLLSLPCNPHMPKASLEGKQQWPVVLCCVSQVWASAATSLLAFVVRRRKITSRQSLCSGKFSTTWASSLPTAWDRWVLGLGSTDIIPDQFGGDCRDLGRKESGLKAVLEKPQALMIHFLSFF